MSEEIVNPTKVYEIYDNFLSKISDYKFLRLDITEEDINEELLSYLKSAIRRFHKCKNSLKIIVSDFGEQIFTVELHPYEIEILTTLMLVEYLKPIVLATDVLKQSLSDKDFRIYSQANQLRELTLLYRMLRTEATKMITEYTYFDMDKDGRKR